MLNFFVRKSTKGYPKGFGDYVQVIIYFFFYSLSTLYRYEWFASSRIDGRIQGLPSAEKLLDNWPLRINDPETGNVDGTVFFNSFVPTIIHHLEDKIKIQFQNLVRDLPLFGKRYCIC